MKSPDILVLGPSLGDEDNSKISVKKTLIICLEQ